MVGKTNANGGGTTIEQYLYGYDLTVTDSTPATRVVYPSAVDNSGFVPAYMDFANSLFNYGSWGCVGGEKFMPKPCMLNYDGTVAYYLNPMDYSKKMDGTASDIENTAFGGNAMIEWGKLYTKRELVGSVYKFRVSNVKIDETYDCWCNYDKDNNVVEHFYTPIYFGSNDGTRLRSLSGKTNYVSGTASDEIALAVANGTDWYTEVLVDHLLIQDLVTLMSKSTASQAKYGLGRCSSTNTTPINTGTMNSRGMFWGDANSFEGVKVFGMENRWGNLHRRTAGWINASGAQKVKITRGTYDGSVATDYNLDGTDYLTISGATPSGTSGGYISVMKNDLPYGRIPITASGSATTYESDALYFNNAQSNYAFIGGAWSNTVLCGIFTALLAQQHTYMAPNLGTSISYK